MTNEEKLAKLEIGTFWYSEDGGRVEVTALSTDLVFHTGGATGRSHKFDFLKDHDFVPPVAGLSQADLDEFASVTATEDTVVVEQVTTVLGSAARMGKGIGHAIAALTTIEGRSMDMAQCQNIAIGALTSILEVLPEARDTVEAYREGFHAIAEKDKSEAEALKEALSR